MIAPLRATSPGSSLWVIETRAVMLVSIIVVQLDSDAFCAGSSPSASPALLTSRSMSRNAAGSARAPRRAPLRRGRRTPRGGSARPVPAPASRADRRGGRCRSTCQPASTNARAAASPIPAVAPVMRAVGMVLELRRPCAGVRARACRLSPMCAPCSPGRPRHKAGDESRKNGRPIVSSSIDRVSPQMPALRRPSGPHVRRY
jgi:hypothetical protein